MTMMNEALEIQARLQALQEWTRRKNDARALGHRRAEWTEQFKLLKKAVDQLEWIGNREQTLEQHQSQVKLVYNLLAQAKQVLTDGGSDEQLTHENQWAKTINATKSLVSRLTESVESGWKTFIADLGSFPAPATIRTTLPMSRPGNRQALAAYEITHAQYQRLTRAERPGTYEDVATIRKLTAHLRELAARFNFAEVPEAVSQFFAAISSGRGAPLALLTNEVRDWLVVEGQVDTFVVVSRAGSQ
jgi:hypothetical protein